MSDSELKNVHQKYALKLFEPEFLKTLARYAPPSNFPQQHRAKIISGRMLEEVVELHFASGGDPKSAMGHVMDAIANEAFKHKKEHGTGGSNQKSYPSRLEFEYDTEEVTIELADVLFLLITNMATSLIGLDKVFEQLVKKVEKLQKAREEGKLIITDQGTFYIRKD